MKQIAVLSASGFGDALLMMIGAHQLSKAGHSVTLFHPNPALVAPLFDTSVTFLPYPEHFGAFKVYDLVLLENDNSEKAYRLFKMRQNGELDQLHVFFHKPSPMQEYHDTLFDQNESVAVNLQGALTRWIKTPTLDNGLKDFKTMKPCPYRIAIHPSSQDKKRNWSLAKFISLANALKNLGYDPIFTLSEKEKELYPSLFSSGHTVKIFEDLPSLAIFYATCSYFIGNDSGPGHLASSLKIPTLTISGNLKHVRKWRPGFYDNAIITPSLPLPNFKGLHFSLRDDHWQKFVSASKVLRVFHNLIEDR